MKLRSVTVKESVSFHSPSDLTLITANGDIEFDEGLRVVVAKPRNGKPTIIIPLENVRCMTPATDASDAEDAAKAAKPSLNGLVGLSVAEVKSRAEAAKERQATAKAGVVKFERGPDGKPVEKTV